MFLGPLLGSGFQTMIPEIQRAVGVEAGWIRPFLAGLLLLVVILFLPGGLTSLIRGAPASRRPRGTGARAAPPRRAWPPAGTRLPARRWSA
jgi:branched-chain amino acid transport system permease protein